MRSILFLTIILSLALPASPVHLDAPQNAPQAIQAPVLKWQNGGCTSWCETGWYSSPAVADLNSDGHPEVIGSGYSISVLDGATGGLLWRMKSGHDRSEGSAPGNVGRTWPGIVVADVDKDGLPEIVTAHSGGYISVYDQNGYFQPGWPVHPTGSEFRGLSVYDLDGDGSMEIIATAGLGSKTNTWVYEPNGALRPGWPRLAPSDPSYAWGVYNANAAAGDLDGDGLGELVIPSDVHYVAAYEANGAQIPANSVYGSKGWGQVGVWESYAIELRGWGTCTSGDARAERYRPNFADSPAAIADVNHDGVNEAVLVGNMYDCIPGYPSKYIGPFIFNADRSRFASGANDWHAAPVDTGAPLSQDYNVIETAEPNPAVADIDGDGNLEILYASYDGRMHAFWLDKTEHGNWPYSVYSPGEGTYRFASEPVIADLDNNGTAEIIFTSWTQKGSGKTGKVHILDYLGNPLQEVSLPADADWNGGLPAPTLDNIDADPDLELVVNTASTGIVAYDLPGTANARVLWGTGRGNYQRSASLLIGDLAGSKLAVGDRTPAPGDTLQFTLTLRDSGPRLNSVQVDNPIPAGLAYAGGLTASSGSASYSSGAVHWSGAVPPGSPVTVQYLATVSSAITQPQVILSIAHISDENGHAYDRQTLVIVNPINIFLPSIAGPG
jgi:uncharacterized repeat protein (TIGR01451 family)